MIKNVSKTTQTNIFILLLEILISIYVSLLIGIVMYFVVIFAAKKIDLTHYIFSIFILACLGFTTFSAWNEGDSDILRYYERFSMFQEQTIALGITDIVLNQRDKGFYFMMLIVARCLPSDPRWFSFFMICTTTFIYLIVYTSYNKSLFNKKSVLILWLICMFTIINIPNYTNAYRQYFAYSVFLFSTRKNGINWKSILIILFAVTCHWSMIMVIIPYFVYHIEYLRKQSSKILLASVILGVLGFGNALYFLNSNTEAYVGAQALGVDKTMMFVQLLTVSFVVYVFLNIRNLENIPKNLFCVLISMATVSYLFTIDSTVITRLSFNWTWTFTILLPILIFKKNRIISSQKQMMLMACIGLFIGYNLISLSRGIPLSYMLFTDYGIQSPFINIINSNNPF